MCTLYYVTLRNNKDEWFCVFFVRCDCRLIPNDAGWRLQNTSSQPTRNSLVAADVRRCAVFRQPPFDVVDGAPCWGDVLSSLEIVLGEPEVTYCRYCDLTSTRLAAHVYHFHHQPPNAGEWAVSTFFMPEKTGWLTHHPPICRSTKVCWRRQIYRLTSRNTQIEYCWVLLISVTVPCIWQVSQAQSSYELYDKIWSERAVAYM